MLKKFGLVVFSVVLLSGCASSKKAGGYAGSDLGQSSSLVSDFEKAAGDRVFFKFDSSDVSREGTNTLSSQAKWLNEHPTVFVTVEGHCDERGTREYNIALGAKRANAVKSVLIKNGVDASRIETTSYGKERPAVIGNDEAAYSQNRRAVTAIR